MKKLTAIALILLTLLTACNKPSVTEPSSSENSIIESSEPSPLPAVSVPSPPAELKISSKVTVYIYIPNSELYEPFDFEITTPEPTLYDVVKLVGDKLMVELPIKEITQQKGMVVMNFDGSFIDTYDKGTISIILNSIATTLRENCVSYEWLQPQLDGETGMLGSSDNGEFIPMPFKLITPSAENFAAIRAKVPYEGLSEHYIENYIVELDGTGKMLADFISRIGYITEDVSSPDELTIEFVNNALIENTKYYFTEGTYENYREELKPFVASVSERLGFREDMFWLKEHVEQTAKLLFGDDYKVTHKTFSKFKYFETEGVYTPPHMGAGGNTIPVIFSYEDLGDRYKVELAYINSGMGGYFVRDKDGEWIDIAEKDVLTYATEKAVRREVILKKTNDGSLNFISCKVIG